MLVAAVDVLLCSVWVDKCSLVLALSLVGGDVAEGEFEEFTTVALRWYGLTEVFVREVVDFEGDNDFLCRAFSAFVKMRYDGGEDLGVGLVELFFYFVGEGVDEGAVFNAHHVDIGEAVVGEYGEDVDIFDAVVHDGGAALIVFEFAYATFQLVGFFEAEVGGELHHLVFEVDENVVEVAFKDASDIFEGVEVVFAAFEAYAGSVAEAYLVFHTGSVGCADDGALASGGVYSPAEVGVAGAVREELTDDVLECTHDGLLGVGSEVLAFDVVTTGEEEAREVFLSYAEIGVGFVVFEEAVVAWLVAFDEVVFEE